MSSYNNANIENEFQSSLHDFSKNVNSINELSYQQQMENISTIYGHPVTFKGGATSLIKKKEYSVEEHPQDTFQSAYRDLKSKTQLTRDEASQLS